MRIIKAKDYNDMSRKAANIIAAQVQLKPDCVLGLATGSTPIGTYKELVAAYESGDLDFSKVTSVNLDEYKGLAPDHEQSYRKFMQDNLFDHISIKPENTIVPLGLAEDVDAMCAAYEEKIEEWGGVDLQLLGIGLDGHIGFNEPDSCFTAETHEVELDESTIEANARFFASKADVPTKAITMGMRSIMQAKKILLIANGAKKKDILDKAFYGPITPEVPASILQLHPDVTVIYSEN